MAFLIGQLVGFQGEKYTILDKRKGSKNSSVNYQSGVLATGLKSNPPTYKLKEGLWVRGNKLIKY